MAKNTNFLNAKIAKNDEFYTQLSDIEKEMRYYKDFFKGKVVYCNCNDARESNFFKYFSMNFEFLGLKKLITTGYKENGRGVVLVYEGDKNNNRKVDDKKIIVNELEGNGDFRSDECIEYLKQADVVVTNPPFSLFRQYVKQLLGYEKKFIIVGNKNAISYKDIFPYIKNNELWMGASITSGDREFLVPKNYVTHSSSLRIDNEGNKYLRVPGVCWYTNIMNANKTEMLTLYKKYNEKDFPKYDNYDAIEVSKTCDIPMDYEGVMGVPITFLFKYNPSQFEIVDAREVALNDKQKNKNCYLIKDADGAINGKPTYARICIRRK